MIWLEPHLHLLRVLDSDPAFKPAYRAVGNIFLHGDVAIACGFLGKMNRRDMIDLLNHLGGRGVKYLIAERTAGHRLPLGKLLARPNQPFDGWFYITIEK